MPLQLVLLAYAALSNPSVRQAYDTHGAAALAASRYDALRKYLISPGKRTGACSLLASAASCPEECTV